jgi:murein DD-endopeptidase
MTFPLNKKLFLVILACSLSIIFSACASTQPARLVEGDSPAAGEKAAATARSMIGRPYRFKGESPEGFDCSGLVRYSYLTAGMELPHGTSALFKISSPVRFDDIRKGDLLFFTQRGRKYSHVGISIGGDRFVHAPSSGKRVREDNLDNPYWKKHFLGARRL